MPWWRPGAGTRKLCRTFANSEKILFIWLFVVLLLHVYEHSSDVKISQVTNTTSARSGCQSDCFRRRLSGPLLWNHASLVAHVRNLIQPPKESSFPRTNDVANEKSKYVLPKNKDVEELQTLVEQFLGERQGVYVVVGAGGTPDHLVTKALQSKPGWTGLLVEANPRNFVRLREATTNASLLNTCVTSMWFAESRMAWRPHGADVRGAGEEIRRTQEEHFMLKEYVSDQEAPLGSLHKVSCVPLDTIIQALQLKEVHLLVLDTPGLADDLLESLSRKNFKYQIVILRAQYRFNGLDEMWYKGLAEEAGLRVAIRIGPHVVMVPPDAPIAIKSVTSS